MKKQKPRYTDEEISYHVTTACEEVRRQESAQWERREARVQEAAFGDGKGVGFGAGSMATAGAVVIAAAVALMPVVVITVKFWTGAPYALLGACVLGGGLWMAFSRRSWWSR